MSKLPNGWINATVGDLGDYWNGRGFKKSEWSDSGRPIVRIQNLTGSGSEFNYFQGDVDDRHVARPGDLLVSWAATLGVYVWDGPEAVINQHIFKVDSRINKKLHRYLLDHVLQDLQAKTHGSGMVHITRRRFEETPIALPNSATEQERIVEVIEEQFSRLDAGVESLQRAKRNLVHLRASVLDAASFGPWPLEALGNLAAEEPRSITDGPFGSNLKTSHYTPAGPRVVRLQNIGDGKFLDDRAHISEEHYARLRNHAVEPGDVLIASLGNELPRSCLAPDWLGLAIVKADCIRFRPGQLVRGSYVSHVLNSPMIRGAVKATVHGVGRPRLNLREIKAIKIPVPPLKTQAHIVAEIDRQFSIIDSIAAIIEAGLSQSDLLRQSVLKNAFAGKPRSPVLSTAAKGAP